MVPTWCLPRKQSRRRRPARSGTGRGRTHCPPASSRRAPSREATSAALGHPSQSAASSGNRQRERARPAPPSGGHEGSPQAGVGRAPCSPAQRRERQAPGAPDSRAAPRLCRPASTPLPLWTRTGLLPLCPARGLHPRLGGCGREAGPVFRTNCRTPARPWPWPGGSARTVEVVRVGRCRGMSGWIWRFRPCPAW